MGYKESSRSIIKDTKPSFSWRYQGNPRRFSATPGDRKAAPPEHKPEVSPVKGF
jgi:hypothetical protein